MSKTIKLTKTQKRVLSILENITIQVKNSKEDAKVYSQELDKMLISLLDNDFFGTEGQTDPRGDQRQ